MRAVRRRGGPPRTRTFRFDGRERTAVLLPSADAPSMRRSTGVASAYYMVAPRLLRAGLPLVAAAAQFAVPLRLKVVREALVRAMTRGAPGPDAEERARAGIELAGEAEDGAGTRVSSWLTMPNGYALTALAAVEIAERLLAAPPRSGFHTPSSAFGPDLLLGLPGVSRRDA
jgi:short subunit dehydrogenase-like uncharacterized protein